MKVVVLMASGEEDTWDDVEDAHVDPQSGTLVVMETEETVRCVYAGGMWIKVEYP